MPSSSVGGRRAPSAPPRFDRAQAHLHSRGPASGPREARARSRDRLPAGRLVDEDGDRLAGREAVDQQGADFGPGQAAQAASERRDRDGADGAAIEDAGEVVEAVGDVLDAAAVAPVALGREVDDEARWSGGGVEDEAAPGPDLAGARRRRGRPRSWLGSGGSNWRARPLPMTPTQLTGLTRASQPEAKRSPWTKRIMTQLL